MNVRNLLTINAVLVALVSLTSLLSPTTFLVFAFRERTAD